MLDNDSLFKDIKSGSPDNLEEEYANLIDVI
jgi:hypothetical protein